MVTALMGFDLDSFLKRQKLTDEHVQFFVYQILRGLKVWTTKCKKLISMICIEREREREREREIVHFIS